MHDGNVASIRILYVDDSSYDRELVRDALRSEPSLTLQEATSVEEFKEALGGGSLDLVISDFNILGYTGLEVIEIVQEKCPGVPVVIVTGTGSEEIAVEAMKRGASDYVIKTHQHIRRLPLTIQSVLEQTRLRRNEERGRAELNRVFALSRDFLCILDANDGRFINANPAAVELLEVSTDGMHPSLFLDFIEPDDRALAEAEFEKARGGENAAQFAVRCRTAGRGVVWIEWSLIHSADRTQLVAVGRDISARVAEEAIRRDRAVASASLSALSTREHEVLRDVAQGLPNKAIAAKLFLSEKTIERHRANGMRKLNLGSVPELVRFAMLSEL